MTLVRDTLINLFARHSWQEVESSPDILFKAFGEKSLDAVTALGGYKEEYDRVKRRKMRIQDIMDGYPGNVGQQALLCLTTLKNLRFKDVSKIPEYQVGCALTLKSIYQTWPEDDQKLFDVRLSFIDSWTDFFLSYTTRDAIATNNYHSQLIWHHFGALKQVDLREKNYVARILAKYLEQGNVRGFKDYMNLQCGDDIEEQILGQCQRTIAFVQLVETMTLQEPELPARNWCLEEYDAFTKATLPVDVPVAVGNRLFFILAANRALPQPATMGESYVDWYKPMAQKLHIVVANCAKPFEELRLEVATIAKQIVNARAKIIDSLLASWP